MNKLSKILTMTVLVLITMLGSACQVESVLGDLPVPTDTPTDPPPTSTSVAAELTEVQRTVLFERVWTLIRDQYAYPDYSGLDWDAIRETYEPRIAAADSDEEFYALIKEMVEQLDSEGTEFNTPQEVAHIRHMNTQFGEYSGIGMRVWQITEGLRVLQTVPNGPAEGAGLGTGDLIVAIDGVAATENAGFGPLGPIGAILGETGTTVALTVHPAVGDEQVVEVTRRAIDLADLVWVEAALLPGTKVGLLTIHDFSLAGLEREIRSALDELITTVQPAALIVDVRTNSGGDVNTMLRTLGLFIDGGSIGTYQQQELRIPGSRTLPELAEMPMVVLIGPDSQGGAELFAAGMQTLGRATIVGRPSAGDTEIAEQYDLAHGARLHVTEGVYRLPDGSLIEGHGVQPDHHVDADWWLYDSLGDPQIQAALALLSPPRQATRKVLSPDAWVITNGTVIDGAGNLPIPDGIVVIRDEKIVDVGQASDFTIPDGVKVLDAAGGTILPGIINAHTYTGNDAQRYTFLQEGVTATCDLGMSKRMLYLVQNEKASPQYPLPRLFKSGPMLTAPGGWPGAVYGSDLNYEVTGIDAARGAVGDLLERGADFIHIAVIPGHPQATWPNLTMAEVKAIVAEAHNRDVSVFSGASVPTINAVLESDVDVLVWGIPFPPYDSEDEFQHAVEAGTDQLADLPDYAAKISSLGDSEIIALSFLERFVTSVTEDRNLTPEMKQAYVDLRLEIVKHFHTTGGTLALGNGYGIPDGPQLRAGMPLREMELLLDAGLTPMAVIEVSTRHAATACGHGEELGTLEPGKLADVIIVDGDPLTDFEAMSRVVAVVKGGEIAFAPEAKVQVHDKPQPEVVARMHDFLNKVAQQNLFRGAVLVAREGEILLRQGYGLADSDNEIANTARTRYRLGSVTKQFTAMAILLLEEQGKLDVQDRVCAYLEACPDGWTNITIHQLLVHTSGIPNFTSMSGFHKLKKEHSTPLQTMAFFKDEPLSFVPGEKWAYSNSGYIVLGVVLEQAAGVPYAAFLQEHIFEPLQMSDSGYEQSDSELAVGYRGRSEALFIDMSVPHAAGGLYSTVEDLYRWDRALYTNELVSDELLDKMFTPHALIPDSEGFGYGYGWGIGEQFDRLIVDHDGAIDGFASYIGRYPEEQVVIIILSNDENLHPNIISEQLAQMIFRNRN